MNHAVATDGVVSALIGERPLPAFFKIHQRFDDTRIADVAGAVERALTRPGTLDGILPGQRIALAVGSRGIGGLSVIVATVAACVKRRGAFPFIVPAMGSHGGATPEGQRRVLAEYGVTEEAVGCPIEAGMETVVLGRSRDGVDIHFAACAQAADGVIPINRVKPHTDYRGRYESGLMKMLVIGLGKQQGAENCHAQSMKYMARNIERIGHDILSMAPIRFGLAIVENACDHPYQIRAIPAPLIEDEEPVLLEEARRRMPAILLSPFDVLIVDEIGKNISGNGMDPNITGSFAGPYASGGAEKQKCVVLDLTEPSHGNGLGLGLADYATARAFSKFSFEATYPNVITNTATLTGKLPLILPNDLMAIRAAVKTCNMIDAENPKIVRIRNTLCMEFVYISEALRNRAEAHPDIEILDGPRRFHFDAGGNLDLSAW